MSGSVTGETDKPRSRAAKSKPEIFLIGALLAVPGVLLAVAWLWTGTYVHRYAITGAVGIVMGICWLLDRLRWINAACALIAVTAVSFVFSTREPWRPVQRPTAATGRGTRIATGDFRSAPVFGARLTIGQKGCGPRLFT